MSTPNPPEWGPQQGPPTGQPPIGETQPQPYGTPYYGGYGHQPYGDAPYGQPAHGQQPYGQPPYFAPPTHRNGLGTSALILGIIGAVLAVPIGWTIILAVIPITLGVIALIQGILGSKRVGRGEATNRGAARAGVVLGVIAVVISLAGSIIFGVFALGHVIDYTRCSEQAGDNARQQEICDRRFSRDFGARDPDNTRPVSVSTASHLNSARGSA